MSHPRDRTKFLKKGAFVRKSGCIGVKHVLLNSMKLEYMDCNWNPWNMRVSEDGGWLSELRNIVLFYFVIRLFLHSSRCHQTYLCFHLLIFCRFEIHISRSFVSVPCPWELSIQRSYKNVNLSLSHPIVLLFLASLFNRILKTRND